MYKHDFIVYWHFVKVSNCFSDMEYFGQQADILKLLQDENVCYPWSHPHDLWSNS